MSMDNLSDSMIDSMSRLPVDIFLKQITHLPYQSVVALCSSSKKSQSYCSTKYSNQWKSLIDNTFSSMINYVETVKTIQEKLGLTEREYNYKVYVELSIALLDPITRAMIAYRQGDMDTFNKFEIEVKFLALFLLNQRKNIEAFLPYDEDGEVPYPYDYLIPIMDNNQLMANKDPLSQTILDAILFEFVNYGNLRGTMLMESKGAEAPRFLLNHAASKGYLDIVKHFLNKYRFRATDAFANAIANNHLSVVKYLVEYGYLTQELISQALLIAEGPIKDYLLTKINQ